MKGLRLLWIALCAAAATLWRRLRAGPRLPGWSAGLEITVETLRRATVEMNRWPPEEMQKLAGGAARSGVAKQVRYEAETLGGVPCERTTVRGGDGSGPVLLYLHGGGMVLGSPQGHRDIVSRIALGSGATVHAPDYRLAPQHPYPASTDDVVAVYRALLEQGVAPERLVVGGDSAGGVLTLALLLRLRESDLPWPAATVAISPAPDLSFPSESWTRNAATDYLSRPVVRQWVAHYARDDQLGLPGVSPIHGRFDGVPPMLVQGGEAECLYDEIVQLVEKLRAEGVDVTFESYPEMPHVWHLLRAFAPQEGDRAIESIARFIRAHAKG
ncbi:MAG: alpha/beta hydrolase [Myxococcota bacterium]